MTGSAAVPDDVEQRVLLALLAMQRLPWEQGVAAHADADLGRQDLLWLLAREQPEQVLAAQVRSRMGGDALLPRQPLHREQREQHPLLDVVGNGGGPGHRLNGSVRRPR